LSGSISLTVFYVKKLEGSKMTSLNNGKLIAGRGDDDRDILRPVQRNFLGVQPGRKIRKNIDPRKNYGPLQWLLT
jgi:hypothetical protein